MHDYMQYAFEQTTHIYHSVLHCVSECWSVLQQAYVYETHIRANNTHWPLHTHNIHYISIHVYIHMHRHLWYIMHITSTCEYICMCIHVYIYIHVYIHICICIYIYMYMYLYIHTYICICKYIYTHIHLYAQTCLYTSILYTWITQVHIISNIFPHRSYRGYIHRNKDFPHSYIGAI